MDLLEKASQQLNDWRERWDTWAESLGDSIADELGVVDDSAVEAIKNIIKDHVQNRPI